MALLKERWKGSIDRRQALTGIPVMHPNVKVHQLTPRTVELRVSVPRGPGFLDRFRPPVLERRYELDEFGTFVLSEIPKGGNVLAIVKAFEEEFRMSHREAELGVVAFMKILMQRNVISVVVRPPAAKAGAETA